MPKAVRNSALEKSGGRALAAGAFEDKDIRQI
jgi:hypothetical protein